MYNKIFAKPIKFVIGAVKVADLPSSSINEVCFVGRSNVGKSSLINALTNNNKVARTSKTPGCTQQINFFDIGTAFHLVDLPGYGYAKASKNKIKNWNQLILDYLRGRQQLVRVYILIDAKVGATRADLEIIKYLESYGIPCQFIMTKTDKVNREQADAQIKALNEIILKYANCLQEILVCSSAKKFGIEEVRENIVDVVC